MELEPDDNDDDDQPMVDDSSEDEDENEGLVDLAANVIEHVGMQEWMHESDEDEMNLIRNKKCTCRPPFNGLGCTHKFADNYVFKMRNQINALPAAQKMMFIMGRVSAGGVRTGNMTETSKRAEQTQRKRNRVRAYFIDGVKICRSAFIFMNM